MGGTGLTPVAACMQSVVFHKWKFSIDITSVPEDLDKDEAFAHLREDGDEPGFWGRPAKESKVLTERAAFTHEELYEAMLYPDFKKKTLGDIDIYTGRPVWQHQFEDIGNRHRGSKFIASDLKRFCAKYTNEQNTFRLH